MIIKDGTLFVCVGTSFSYGEWTFSRVTLSETNVLKIEIFGSPDRNKTSSYHLSSEWFIIAPRSTTVSNCPPLPENNKQDGLFALTQPSEATIWFLCSSKYERNQWIEKILPIITLKPPTPPEPPPPYSEYDNLSYFPWDTTPGTTKQAKDQNSFTFPRPSMHRSGFYSLEKPIKKQPKPVEPAPALEPPPPSEPVLPPVQPGDSHQCVNCCSLGCAFMCNTLAVCLQMCCNNFGAAF